MTGPKTCRRLTREHIVSLVIPCHNEADVLPMLFERINDVAAMWDAQLEVILVDDGSHDATWQQMCRMSERDPRWKLVQLSRNFGHQTAVWTGLKHVTGDLVAVLDADLQDPPEVLADFFHRWEAGYDVVYAVRRKRKEGFFKRFAYHSFYRLMASMAEISVPLDSGDFCVMDRDVVEVMLQSGEMRPFVRGIRAWGRVLSNRCRVRARRASGGRSQLHAAQVVCLGAGRNHQFFDAAPEIGHVAGSFGLGRCTSGLRVYLVAVVLRNSVCSDRSRSGAGLLNDRDEYSVPGRRAVDLPGNFGRVRRSDLREREEPPPSTSFVKRLDSLERKSCRNASCRRWSRCYSCERGITVDLRCHSASNDAR